MKNFLIFFFVIGLCGFIYFSYVTFISKSLQNKTPKPPSETERILAEQRLQTESMKQDYRRIMEDNKRTMEENRRAMEDLRRQSQQR